MKKYLAVLMVAGLIAGFSCTKSKPMDSGDAVVEEDVVVEEVAPAPVEEVAPAPVEEDKAAE